MTIYKELEEFMKKKHNENVFNALNEMILFLRHLEKEETGKGIKELKEMLTNGSLKMNLYLKVRKAVENPDVPYEITITK